jgi:hypothetical protein
MRKNKVGRPKQQFCLNDHDTFACGRNSQGYCNDCKRIQRKEKRQKIKEGKLIVKAKKQFCPQGHDTFIVGRDTNGMCNECKKTYYPDYAKQWYKDNEEELVEYHRKWYIENKEAILKQHKKWKTEHKKEILEQTKKYVAQRMKEDPLFRLIQRLRVRLYKAIRYNYKAGSAIKDLGCSITFLKQYLEDKFYDKMSWDNYGTYWEIDHIKALWKFSLADRRQFLKAVNYKNLQPLTVPDHKKKTTKEAKERSKLRALNDRRK